MCVHGGREEGVCGLRECVYVCWNDRVHGKVSDRMQTSYGSQEEWTRHIDKEGHKKRERKGVWRTMWEKAEVEE